MRQSITGLECVRKEINEEAALAVKTLTSKLIFEILFCFIYVTLANQEGKQSNISNLVKGSHNFFSLNYRIFPKYMLFQNQINEKYILSEQCD